MEENSVAVLTDSASAIHLDTRFDEFLFTTIGEDRNGICVTVLTALARLNFDPWKKAAELSGLPCDAAKRSLRALIAKLPDLLPPNLESGTIDRLVDLLPTRVSAPAINQTFGLGVLTNARAFLVYMTLMAVMMGAYHVWENLRVHSEPESSHTAAGSASVPSKPEPSLQQQRR